IDATKISYQNIKVKNNQQIYLTKNQGQIKIHVPNHIRKRYSDFYLNLKVRRGQPDSNYTININNYANHRLYNNSTYKTGVEYPLFWTQADNVVNISIAVTHRGSDYFDIQSLHGENYSSRRKSFNKIQVHYYNDIKNGVKVK